MAAPGEFESMDPLHAWRLSVSLPAVRLFVFVTLQWYF